MSADIIARGMAAAQSRSANTQALIKALRTQAIFPQPAWRTLAGDVASITVPAGGAASTFAGGTFTGVTDRSKVSWLSGAADKDANITYASRGAWYGASRQTNYSSYEFIHTGTRFESYVLCSVIDATAPNFRVLVGDKVAGTAAVPADGAFRPLLVVFPTSGTRRIRIELSGGRHGGILTQNANEIGTVSRSYPLVTVIGDSFGEGTGAWPYDGEAVSAIRAIGCNCALGAVGGTGILNPATGGKVNWQDANRLSDLALNGFTDQITNAAPSPALGVIMMSINDNGMQSANWNGAATYQAAIAKGLFAMVDHWQVQRPGKPLVVFGPTWPTEAPPLDIYRMRDAGQEVCAGLSNVWFIDRLGAGPVLRKGTISSTVTTGTLTNASKIITALASTSGVVVGSMVLGTGIPVGARVASVDSATQVTIDVNATAGGAGIALTFRNDPAGMYTVTTDSTHPNQFGHNLDAMWMARQLRELILTQFA